MEDFIKLRQGGMSVLDYSLKFTKLSKYAPYLVEECHADMFHDNMDISNLMMHAPQVKESRLKINNSDVKRSMSFEGGSSKGLLEIQGKPIFKKRFSNQAPFKFLKAHDDRVSKHMSQKVRSAYSPNRKPICRKCGKKHCG